MELNTVVYLSVGFVGAVSLVILIASYFISKSKNAGNGLNYNESGNKNESDKQTDSEILKNHLDSIKIIGNDDKSDKDIKEKNNSKKVENSLDDSKLPRRMQRINNLTFIEKNGQVNNKPGNKSTFFITDK